MFGIVCVWHDRREESHYDSVIPFLYVCPFPILLDVREIAFGRGAMPDKLIWEPFSDREVMTDDWPNILLPSAGIGDGDREMKWEELLEDANTLLGKENEPVGEPRLEFCRSGIGVPGVVREDFDFNQWKENNLRIGYINRPLEDIGEGGRPLFISLPSSIKSP